MSGAADVADAAADVSYAVPAAAVSAAAAVAAAAAVSAAVFAADGAAAATAAATAACLLFAVSVQISSKDMDAWKSTWVHKCVLVRIAWATCRLKFEREQAAAATTTA